jgi:hypothetical protein
MFTAKHASDYITIAAECDGELTDYGVPHSPRWYEPNLDTIRVTSLEICGVDVDFEALPGPLQDALLALAEDWERI